MVFEAIKMKEEKDLFFNNKDEEKKLGCIGYLRGDFGGGGREFWTTWFQHNFGERNDEKFKFIFDAVINKMRAPCGVLFDRESMRVPYTAAMQNFPSLRRTVGISCFDTGLRILSSLYSYARRL